MVFDHVHCLRMAEQATQSSDRARTHDQQKLLLRIADQWAKLAEHIVRCERLTAEPEVRPVKLVGVRRQEE